MDNKNKKTEPWRIVVFVLAIAFIVFIWVKKTLRQFTLRCPRRI